MTDFPMWISGPKWLTGPEGGQIAHDAEQERRIRALNAAWSGEIAKPIGQREWFRFGELADKLACDPRTLASAPTVRGRIVEELVVWTRRGQFDLAVGEVATLCGDPPSFEPLPSLLEDASLSKPEVLMLRREAAYRFVAANDQLPGAAPLLRQLVAPATPVLGQPVAGRLADMPAEAPILRGQRGRKRGSGSIDDDAALRQALSLLAAGEVPSALAAATRAVEGAKKPNHSRDAEICRVYRKFRARWKTEPPPGKTWADVQHEFNTN